MLIMFGSSTSRRRLNAWMDVITVVPRKRLKAGSVKRGSSIFGLDPVLVDGILDVGG